ncbi:MFS transporter [Edaphobacter acidisoli]|uniref:MFS transporter n=1 Tax=Edaphobacter acidisoli TaxID=2040573 RepID=A0A916RMA8_9BACT|nr:MFS transporter [Edaphobacter acidisoli]GGA61951.1 MFS transporter [Edaphobacter acidisoli]
MHPASDVQPNSRAEAFRALAPVFFYFAIGGVATVMLGPLLPALIGRYQIQDAQAGTLFTFSFAGQLCGAWIAVRNLRASVLYGALLSVAGCLAMAWAPFDLAHFALFVNGLGLGLGLTAGNVIAGTYVTEGRARLLALLNTCWSIGAILCPVLVRACGPSHINIFFYVLSAIFLISAAASVTIPRASARERQQPQTKSRLPLSPSMIFFFSCALLLYVGIENALGGWLPTYAVRVDPTAHAADISFCFWLAEMAGRFLMSTPLNFLSEKNLYKAAATLLIAAQALFIAIPHLPGSRIELLTIATGLAIAPIYPLILSFLLSRTGKHPHLGPLFASASLGGATFPWFTGIVSTHFHDLRTGLIVPTIGTFLILLLATVIAQQSKPRLKQAVAKSS